MTTENDAAGAAVRFVAVSKSDVIWSVGGKCINARTLLGNQYDYCASCGGFAWYVSDAGNPGC